MASCKSQDSSCDDSEAASTDTDAPGGMGASPADGTLLSDQGGTPAALVVDLDADQASSAGASTASEISSSQVASSEDSSAGCPKKANKVSGKTRLQDAGCLKLRRFLKTKAKKISARQVSSASTDSQSETGDDSSAATADDKPSGKGVRKSTRAKGTTADAPSSAPSSSEPDSCSEPELSDVNDDVSTDPSTPGADSSKEASSDEEEEDVEVSTGKSGGASSDGKSAWSVSEDLLLRGMKKSQDRISWQGIGMALNRSKDDVKARWKALEAQTASSAEESEGQQVALKPAKTSGGKKKGKSIVRKKQHNDSGAKPDKAARIKAAEASENEQDVLSGDEASSESSAPVDGEDEGGDDEDDDDDKVHYGWPDKARNDRRYLHKHVYRELYPRLIQPEPDEFFGEHDCAVLAAVHSRHKRSKWLEMQANFFNVTGRMVPLHLIRDKCEGAERGAEAHREQVERWVDGVPQDDLKDPEL